MGSSDRPNNDDSNDLVDLAYERAKRTHPSHSDGKEFFFNKYEYEGIWPPETAVEDSLYGGPCPNNNCDHPAYDHDSEGRCHAAASETQSPSGWGLCGCGRSGGEHIS